MDRSNPYEAAFESYLQLQGLCTVAVDESRRTHLGTTSVKNLDFIVLSQMGLRLLVDVKGRQFPGGPTGKQRYVWENWCTQEDLSGMASWTRLFGPGSVGLLVFLYRIGNNVTVPADTPDLWHWREQRVSIASGHRRVLSPPHESAQPQMGNGMPAQCRFSRIGQALPFLQS